MAIADKLTGPAGKIEGLLQPSQEGQEASQPKAEPSEQPQTEDISQNDQAQAAGAQEEPVAVNESDSEETSEVVEEPNLHRVKIQGQEQEVSLDELKNGYSRDADYRQKTHQLSMEKQDFETERGSLRLSVDNKLNQLNELIATADTYVNAQQGSQDLKTLWEEDPSAAAKLDYQLRIKRDQLNDMKTQAQDQWQSQYNTYLGEQRSKAKRLIPEFSDPSKEVSFKAKLRTGLATYGFNENEINTISDARQLVLIRDALAYKDLQNKKPLAQKKAANAPKVMKSGVAKGSSGGRNVVRDKIGKLRKTHHVKDAQSAILEMINLQKK